MTLAVAGANRHDVLRLAPTRASLVVRRPRPTRRRPLGRCLDTADDVDWVYPRLAPCGLTAHVRGRGEEARMLRRIPGARARRWVVERTPSWINRFRTLLVRRDKQTANYVGSLQLARAYIAQ